MGRCPGCGSWGGLSVKTRTRVPLGVRGSWTFSCGRETGPGCPTSWWEGSLLLSFALSSHQGWLPVHIKLVNTPTLCLTVGVQQVWNSCPKNSSRHSWSSPEVAAHRSCCCDRPAVATELLGPRRAVGARPSPLQGVTHFLFYFFLGFLLELQT